MIGQAGLKKKAGLALPALIIGANLPDVDAACLFWLEGAEHLGFRRGITHGPPALVLLPLILAGLLWWFDRWQTKRGKRPQERLPVHFGWLYGLSFLACLTHPALDWLNVYGIRLLEPFSSQWFYGDTLFIIDVWLWALMGFATWWSLRREKQGGQWRRPARVAIAASLAYIGMNGAITYHAENMQARMNAPYPMVAIASPPPLFFWQREVIIQLEDMQWLSTGWSGPEFGYGYFHKAQAACKMPTAQQIEQAGTQAQAFAFWSRAPFAERAADGSVILRDARFYDPRARDRFSVALPDAICQPPKPSPDG